MTTCPNNIWNHTDGCTCVPNGSVLAESADVALSMDRPNLAHVINLAEQRLADEAWVEANPVLAELYEDPDFLEEAEARIGKPFELQVQMQAWGESDYAVDTESHSFDASPVLDLMPASERDYLAGEIAQYGYPADAGDNIYEMARDRGLVEDNGPQGFYVYTHEHERGLAAWMLANPPKPATDVLRSEVERISSATLARKKALRSEEVRIAHQQDRIELAKELLGGNVPEEARLSLSRVDESTRVLVSVVVRLEAVGSFTTRMRDDRSFADFRIDNGPENHLDAAKVYDWVRRGGA